MRMSKNFSPSIQESQDFAAWIRQKKKDQFFRPLFNNPGEVIIPPTDGAPIEIDIKNDYSFEGGILTIDYSTLVIDPANPPTIIDDGICRITVEILDGSDDFPLQSGPIPLNLISSPGRIPSPGVVSPFAPTQFLLPFPSEYTFGANGAIRMNFFNSSDAENTVHINWNGNNLLNQQVEFGDF